MRKIKLNDKTKKLMGLPAAKDTAAWPGWAGTLIANNWSFNWLTPDNIDDAERTMKAAIDKAEQAAQKWTPQDKNDLNGDDFQALRASIFIGFYSTLRRGGFPADYIEKDKKVQLQFFTDLSLKYGMKNSEIAAWVKKGKFRKGAEDRFLVALPNLKKEMMGHANP